MAVAGCNVYIGHGLRRFHREAAQIDGMSIRIRESACGTYTVVGWIKSKCGLTLAGTEYARVRMALTPVSECSKVENSVPSMAFAFATGTSMLSHWLVAPGVAFTPLRSSHAVTAARLSALGATYCSTLKQSQTFVCIRKTRQAYLRLAQELTVALAARCADLIELINQTRVVALLECNPQLQDRVRMRSPARCVPLGCSRSCVMNVKGLSSQGSA